MATVMLVALLAVSLYCLFVGLRALYRWDPMDFLQGDYASLTATEELEDTVYSTDTVLLTHGGFPMERGPVCLNQHVRQAFQPDVRGATT